MTALERLRPLRIMRVIARMNVGGPALQVSTLMRGLDPDLFDQRLYVGLPEPGEGDYRELRAPDVPVYPIATLGRSVRPMDDLRAALALAQAIRSFRPDIIHTHTAKAGTLGRIAAVTARVPVRVHTFHGHLLHGYFPPAKTQVLIQAERALARVSTQLLAVGARVRDELLAAGVGRPQQFTVVPPGVTLPPQPSRAEARRLLGLVDGGPVVAVVGRVTTIKRPDRMLDVARLVRQSFPDVRFVVCGEGDQLAETIRQATADDLDVTFLRWRPDVETVYAAADLVLLTSDNEGMPVSLIEAGLTGRAAVATDVGGVSEVVRHGETGLLARPYAQDLARHVISLLGDTDLRAAMGRAAQAFTAAHFGSERLLRDTAGLYRRAAVERAWWPHGWQPPAQPGAASDHSTAGSG